jgi:hypothetical protein
MTQTVVDEVMLREPRLLVPKTQPVGLVKLDLTNGLTRGLVGCWALHQAGWKNLVRGKKWDGQQISALPLPTHGVRSGISGAIFSGTQVLGVADTVEPADFLRNRDWTIAGICILDSASGYKTLYCNGVWHQQVRFEQTTGVMSLLVANKAYVAGTTNTASINTLTIASASCDAGGNYQLWLNGLLGASGTTTEDFSTALGIGKPAIGAHDYNTEVIYEPMTGVIPLALWSHRAWTAAEHQAFQFDPYQFLVPAT